MLVLEDPGGEPLDRRSPGRWRWGHSCASPSASRRLWARSTSAASSTRTSSRQYSGESRDRRGPAHRFRHRLAAAARAPGARTARVHRRHARLHGARADRTDESLDRFAQRPLCARRHALRDADRHAAVHGVRSDGMGALPHREAADAARRAAEGRSRRRVGDRHEAARQDRRGALPDRGRPRERSSALPCRMGSSAPHRRIPAWRSTTRQTGC